MAEIKCEMCGGMVELPENAQSAVCEHCGSTVMPTAGGHRAQLHSHAGDPDGDGKFAPTVQCKMCGAPLALPENAQSGTCEYCGAAVTFPKITTEAQERLYARAEHFRRLNDYDKALHVYKQIVAESPDDAEAYWGVVLCRYGIEYVEDPTTHERIPTCHRVSYDSILKDEDYLAVLEHAGSAERGIYEAEAALIAEIQNGILAVASKEEPFDIFICYKESDDSGQRTRDSVAAQEIYYALTEHGYKVFFARVTLEDKLGRQYEPYIFAALNSAKAMLVVGFKPEHFNAVWVRNEWSRYLELMKRDRSRILIPCYRDMDAYDIPEELSMFQAQDMGKLGFIQDLLRGIVKVTKGGTPSPAAGPAAPSGGENPLLIRARLFVETGDFKTAREYCDRVLDAEPQNGAAYFCRLMAELKISDEAALVVIKGLEDNSTFKLARKFATGDTAAKLDGLLRRREEIRAIHQRAEQRLESIKPYFAAVRTLDAIDPALEMLRVCIKAEKSLLSSSAPTPHDEAEVRTATENTLAGLGDLAELERRVAEKAKRLSQIYVAIVVVVAVVTLVAMALSLM